MESITTAIQLELITKAHEIAQQNCGTLLYLTAFGSHLYGTVTEKTSDIDVKGIFLPFVNAPSEEVMLRGKIHDSEKVCYTNNWIRTSDHTKTKYEIELWSLQLWLNRFLKNGDTGAVDTFYAYTKHDTVLYVHPCMTSLFHHATQLFNPLNTRSFLGYAIGQAQRYGVKGIRLQVLLNILDFFNVPYHLDDSVFIDVDAVKKILEIYSKQRLETHIEALLEKCEHDLYCHYLIEDGQRKFHGGYQVIRVNGKIHQGSIFVPEFIQRIALSVREYGHRATKALASNGKDWKALSHAYRVILELEELLTTGEIVFPLTYYRILCSIKLGDMPIEDVRELISDGLLRIDQLRKTTTVTGAYDKKYVDQFIISCYHQLGINS